MQFDIHYGMNAKNLRGYVPDNWIANNCLDAALDYVYQSNREHLSLDRPLTITNKISYLEQAILNLAAVLAHLTKQPDPPAEVKPRQILKDA